MSNTGILTENVVLWLLNDLEISVKYTVKYTNYFKNRWMKILIKLFRILQRLQNDFYIYIYIYTSIVIHRQICFVLSELISVARHISFPLLGSKPGWLKRQSKRLTLQPRAASNSEVNFNCYESQLLLFTYIRLTATETSIHVWRDLQ